MVAHNGAKAKEDTKAILADDPEVRDIVRRSKSKCLLVTSLLFNFVMLLMLIGCVYYLCRYRREIHDMKVQHRIGKSTAKVNGWDGKAHRDTTTENASQGQSLLENAYADFPLEKFSSAQAGRNKPSPESHPHGRPRHHNKHHHQQVHGGSMAGNASEGQGPLENVETDFSRGKFRSPMGIGVNISPRPHRRGHPHRRHPHQRHHPRRNRNGGQ